MIMLQCVLELRKNIQESIRDFQRWEVATVNKDDKMEQISFVNGINTFRGGKHVKYVEIK